MPIEASPLPYDATALEPHLSGTVVARHRARQEAHLAALSSAIADGPLDGLALEDVVRQARGATFDHAAQAWNDAFYWNALRPVAAHAATAPTGALSEAVAAAFGDLAGLKRQFAAVALRITGSGWVWLVRRLGGALAVVATANSATPLTGDDRPLLACSLWEHAWIGDHESRERYLDAFWQLVDWKAVAARL